MISIARRKAPLRDKESGEGLFKPSMRYSCAFASICAFTHSSAALKA